jgi:peptidoglycan/xylan/chitin deacetylase (PgdA/CDA1 family)
LRTNFNTSNNRHILINPVRNIIFLTLLIILTITISCTDNYPTKSPMGMIVILKADDLADTTANWNRFINVIEKKKISAGIGVIAQRVTSKGAISEIRRISEIKQSNEFPVIEFWNHGLDHIKRKGKGEFVESRSEQTERLIKSQQIIKKTSFLTSHSFGAPFNITTSTTADALESTPEISVWQCYQIHEKQNNPAWKDPKKGKISANDKHVMLDVDYASVNNFDENKIIENFDKDKKKPYVLIQIHPNVWHEKHFQRFERLIDFYKSKNITFMTPYQYYEYLHGNETLTANSN